VPQRIGVGWIPTDEGEDALGVAYRIARVTGGSVELVTTTSTTGTIEGLDTRARRAIDGAVDALGGEVEVAVRAGVGKAAEDLVNHSGNMDLVVLGSRGYGPPRTMLLGSVSSQVIPEALCPVMILAAGSQSETRT
jgi:nucleotide-binding universal stress UspA family protein